MSTVAVHGRAYNDAPGISSMSNDDFVWYAAMALDQVEEIKFGWEFIRALYGSLPGQTCSRRRGKTIPFQQALKPHSPQQPLAKLLHYLVSCELVRRTGCEHEDIDLRLVQPRERDYYHYGADGAFEFRGVFATFDVTTNPYARTTYADVFIRRDFILESGVWAIRSYAAEIARKLCERLR